MDIKEELKNLAEAYGIKDESFLLAVEEMIKEYNETFKGLKTR